MKSSWNVESEAPIIPCIFSIFLSIKYTFNSEGGQKIKLELSVVSSFLILFVSQKYPIPVPHLPLGIS